MAQHSKIRRATKADEQLLKQIYKEARKELGSFNLFQCWTNYLSGVRGEFFMVLPKIGFVRWGFMNKYKCNVIKDIGVLKSEQGRGYGAMLVKSVPCTVMLKCNEDNAQGNAFYKSLGMQQAGRTFTKKGNPQIIWTCAEW